MLAAQWNEAKGLQVIPVIDVLEGVAVAARHGDRANYQPLQTPLARGNDPVAIARGFLELYPFDAIYVADLDAIEGRAPNQDVIARLREALPDVAIWVDAAVSSPTAAQTLFAQPGVRVIVGSESVTKLKDCQSLLKMAPNHTVLSLDLDIDGFRGPFDLLTSPQIWPSTIIAMSISTVGSGAGPNLEYLKDVRKLAGEHREVYAAGGIRNYKDCQVASNAGASGVLIATALHSQNIKADDLIKIAGL